MKCFNLLLLIIFSNCIFSQNKAMVPASGTIAFSKNEVILNKEVYLKSMKALVPKMLKAMKQQINMERSSYGKQTDSLQLKSIMSSMEENMEMYLYVMMEEKDEVNFYLKFHQDTLVKYTTNNGCSSNERFINQVTGTITNELKEFVELEKNDIIKVTEYKNENKLINGYNCFKVVYKYNNSQVSDFDFLSAVVTNTRELWVTQEIKCKYHPVVNDNEILEKYFPLEIIEYSDEINGSVTNFKLIEFSLNK